MRQMVRDFFTAKKAICGQYSNRVRPKPTNSWPSLAYWQKQNIVHECGFMYHMIITGWSASPDGIIELTEEAGHAMPRLNAFLAFVIAHYLEFKT